MLLSILQVNSEDLTPYAIVCGDPFRAEAISRKLDNARELSFSREYRTFVGEKNGVPITVVSHGVGSPGAAVCFEELIKGGVKTLIRVGTAGSYSADVPPGSLVVSTAAVREEGLTRQLVPHGFPAVADHAVTRALYEAASETDGLVKQGITVTLDAFFQGVEEFPIVNISKLALWPWRWKLPPSMSLLRCVVCVLAPLLPWMATLMPICGKCTTRIQMSFLVLLSGKLMLRFVRL